MINPNNIRDYVLLSLEGKELLKRGSVEVDAAHAADLSRRVGVASMGKDFDRFVNTIELDQAVAIQQETDHEVKNALRFLTPSAIVNSVAISARPEFENLEVEDFVHLASVLKIANQIKAIPEGMLGFELGGLATVRRINGFCYVCTEKLVTTTDNPYSGHELVLEGFFKVKSDNECLNILDDLEVFSLSFNLRFINDIQQGAPRRTVQNEAENGIPVDLKLFNWDGSEDLILEMLVYDPDVNAPSVATDRVDYSYYNPSAVRDTRFKRGYFVDLTIPAGTKNIFNGFLPMLTEDSFSKDTVFEIAVNKATTANGKRLYTFDFSNVDTYTFDQFLVLDNDPIPVAQFGNFIGTIDQGETKSIPVDLSKLPSTPLSSKVRLVVSNDSDIEILGSPIVTFGPGGPLTKNYQIKNNGESTRSFTLDLVAVENVRVFEQEIQLMANGEDVALDFPPMSTETSTNTRFLPLVINRSGGQGQITVRLAIDETLTTGVAGTDFVFVDPSNGQQTNDLPIVYLDEGVAEFNQAFVRFLNPSVDTAKRVALRIDSAVDVTNNSRVLFNADNLQIFSQVVYERDLTDSSTAFNGAGEVILNTTFDSEIEGDLIEDNFRAIVHPSTEIGANESAVGLSIPRNIQTKSHRTFTIPDGDRFENKTFRFTLQKIGDVLQFDESEIHEVVIPANALSNDPVAGFTTFQDPVEPSIVEFTDTSSEGTFPIASYLWDFGDGESDTIDSPHHEYAAPGTYDVTLTVTDTRGNTNSITKQVVYELYQRTLTGHDDALNGAEEVIITATFDNVDTGSTVQDQFKAKVHASSEINAAETEVVLTFDRSSGTAQLRSFTFPNEDRYQNKVFRYTLVKIGDVLLFDEATVYEVEVPANAVTVEPTAGFVHEYDETAPTAVAFSDNSSQGTFPIATYHWDLGDGSNATGSNVYHSYGSPDIYNVTLTVTDTMGNTNSVTKAVSSPKPNTAPTADFEIVRQANMLGFVLDGSNSSDPENDNLTFSVTGDDGNSSIPSFSQVQNLNIDAFKNNHNAVLTVEDEAGLSDTKSTQFFTPEMSLSGSIIRDDRAGGQQPYVFKVMGNVGQPINYTDNSPAGAIDVFKVRITTQAGSQYHPYFDNTPPSLIYTEYGIGDEFTVTSPDQAAPINGGNEADCISGAEANPGRIYYSNEGRNVVFYVGIARQGAFYASSPIALFYIEFHQDQIGDTHKYTLVAEGSTNFYSLYNPTQTELQAFLA
jgi:PKD repeat protein